MTKREKNDGICGSVRIWKHILKEIIESEWHADVIMDVKLLSPISDTNPVTNSVLLKIMSKIQQKKVAASVVVVDGNKQ